MSNSKLADTIRNKRLDRGLTMLEVAQIAGCDKSMISYVESGARTPGLDMLAKIAKALDTTLPELLS